MSPFLWVLVGLAGLVCAIILLLCIPIDIVLTVDTAQERKFRIRLIGLFGLVDREIQQTEKKPATRQRTERRKGKRIDIRMIWRILNTKGFLFALKKLTLKTLHQIHIEEGSLKLTIGFDDPAEGGMVFAIINMVKPFIPESKRFKLEVQPSFSDHSFVQVYLRGIFHIQPIRLLVPMCRFVFSKPTFKIARMLASNASKS